MTRPTHRAAALTAAVALLGICVGAGAGPAAATPSSTYSFSPHAIDAPGVTETVGECTATAFPGVANATGAPDGVPWTIDVSARSCDSDDHDAMLRFILPDCGSFSGITGVQGIITTLAQTAQAGYITWGIITPANNLLTPGSQLANDAGGDLTTDFSSAPIPKAQLLTLLATKSMVSIETKGVAGRVYNIDAFALSITGDLSHCHIDQDGDGLDNVQEAHYGTNPLVADTDGGGVPDGVEVQRRSNPLDPADDANWPPPTSTSTTTAVAQLPRTGSSSAPLSLLAGLLVMAGAVAAGIASTRARATRSRR